MLSELFNSVRIQGPKKQLKSYQILKCFHLTMIIRIKTCLSFIKCIC